jgi:thioredoxin reductase/SAM-dependent methyltransferase
MSAHQHSEHQPCTVERHCDVAVIGGSAAGLAAALQLGRQRRSVIVIDAGEPRNAAAAHMHSYLGHEGIPPGELATIARNEVRSYGGEVVAGRATDVTRIDERHFQVSLVGGHTVIARRVLAATGLVDELPDIEGLTPHWGGDVIHCPFCHGYEVRDLRIVQIVTHTTGLHQAGLFRQLTERLTLVLHDNVTPDNPTLNTLRAAGVEVIDQRVQRVMTGDDGHVSSVELHDGSRIPADAVVIGTRFAVRADTFASLGLLPTPHPIGLGDYIQTDPTGATSVPGLHAAGNVTDPSQQVLQAAAQGSWVGGMISFSLASEDIETASRTSANEADWDYRYTREQLWSGNPNGTLVNETSNLAPGRALDVGAGEGGDALWLAEHGWHVTATDISQRGLDRIAAVATDRNLAIECVHADANTYRPFATAAFDLVTAHYASIPRTPDRRAIHNLLDAVAPGGILLVVSHDLEPMRTPIETQHHSRPFDPDAYLRVEDFLTTLTNTPGWDIETNDKRPRPPGATTASHHVDDIVLRARRHHTDQ